MIGSQPASWSSGLKERLHLDWEPVGVKFWPAPAPAPRGGFEKAAGLRYCQGLMLARRGKTVRLESQDISCPAAASAFGFRPLPAGLASGQGLVGFGIAKEAATGKAMFAGMARLEHGWLGAVDLAPLGAFQELPDVVVVEDRVERLMWLLLANVNLKGGARVAADTAVLQATCVDSTLVPFLEKRINFSFGCYGCREATDIEPGETVVGFPGELLPALAEEIERLAERAIPRSRAKQPYAALAGKSDGAAGPFGGDPS
jgi:uncharacterized protein (DUF169 family)